MAGAGVTLVGGKKDDKFTGSSNDDTFFYAGGGKDQILNYASGDKISLGEGFELSKIKNISATSSKVKLTFTTANTLTVKGTVNTLNVNGTDYTFDKDAIIADDKVSLTSGAGGTKTVKNLKHNHIDATEVKKNLRLVGNGDSDTLIGGKGTTTLNGGSGEDTLVGGEGKDIFEYTKGDTGNKTIQKFEFGKDVLDIANTTINEITKEDNSITFHMASGRKSDREIASFVVDTSSLNDQDKVVIKAKNNYYWFYEKSDEDITTDGDKEVSINKGDLITSSALKAAPTGYSVIDLNYSLNLYKAIGDRLVATKLSDYSLNTTGTYKKS